jgi:hypothetical protein
MKISICGFPCHGIESIIELEMTTKKLINYTSDAIQTNFEENMFHGV